jgi:thiol:disulfide interchange protein/DsbC/DsbD-like thiol-disulfide interchange protein
MIAATFVVRVPTQLSACLLFVFLALFAPLSANAALTRAGHVEVELVSEYDSVKPGTTFYAALHIVHDTGWHTYWTSSTTGFPPTIKWKLPQGMTAGALQHPLPEILLQGGIVDYIHTGEILLPVLITVDRNFKARAGDKVMLKANAEWLVCLESCVPGAAELELELPVTGGEPKAVGQWSGRIREVVNLTSGTDAAPTWTFKATQKGRAAEIDVKGDGSFNPGRLYFYSSDGYLAANSIEEQQTLPDGTIRMTLPFSQYAPDKPETLRGVMTARNGWGNGQPKAFALAAELNSTPVTAIAAKDAAPSAKAVTFLPAIWLALLGGLILNLMPCVFPVLGLKVMSFVKLAGKKGGAAWVNALAFALGVMATLTVLAGILLVMRAAGGRIGWGFQLQDPRVLFIGVILFLLFALNMAGMFEIGLSASSIGANKEKHIKSELIGAFFSGVLAVVVATPCSAPFLGSAIGYAFARPPYELVAVFWAVGVGFSLPYLVLAAFPKLLAFLPKPGQWMVTLRKILSLLLFATVAYLLWALSPFIGGRFTYLAVSIALLFTTLAAYLYGQYADRAPSAPKASPGFRTGRTSGASLARVKTFLVPAILLAASVFIGWPGENTAHADAALSKNPVPAFEEGDATPHFTEWRPGLAEKLAREGKIVWVDYTARWCATCQVNKAVIFSSPEVRALFKQHKVIALKADWTGRDATISHELAKWNRYAVPFNLIYAPGKKPVEMPTVLTPGIVAEEIKKAAE